MTARELLRAVAQVVDGTAGIPALSALARETLRGYGDQLRALADRFDAEERLEADLRKSLNGPGGSWMPLDATRAMLARLDADLRGDREGGGT